MFALNARSVLFALFVTLPLLSGAAPVPDTSKTGALGALKGLKTGTAESIVDPISLVSSSTPQGPDAGNIDPTTGLPFPPGPPTDSGSDDEGPLDPSTGLPIPPGPPTGGSDSGDGDLPIDPSTGLPVGE